MSSRHNVSAFKTEPRTSQDLHRRQQTLMRYLGAPKSDFEAEDAGIGQFSIVVRGRRT